MTLSFRNKFILIWTMCSFLLFALLIFFTFIGFKYGVFSNAPEKIRPFYVFNYSTVSVIASIAALLLYVSLAGLFLYFTFEKTQSQEIIFFGIFLISCLFESFRFVVLFFNSRGMYPDFLLFAARCIFFGRICATLAFLVAALFSSSKLEQDTERSSYLIFAGSIMSSVLIPFNTIGIVSNGMLNFAYMNIIFLVRILLACITFFAFFINGMSVDKKEFKLVALGFLMLFSGYILLTLADTFVFFTSGTILLLLGTIAYLHSLHSYYLWK